MYNSFGISLNKDEDQQLRKNIEFIREYETEEILLSQCKTNKPFQDYASNKDIVMYAVRKRVDDIVLYKAKDGEEAWTKLKNERKSKEEADEKKYHAIRNSPSY